MSQLSRRYHGNCRSLAATQQCGGWMNEESFEEQQEALDPHRREERDFAALEFAGRLRQKGVLLTGRETSAQLDDLMTAIDRFEAAVIARGGDLFVNMPTSNRREPAGESRPLEGRPRGEQGDEQEHSLGASRPAYERAPRARQAHCGNRRT